MTVVVMSEVGYEFGREVDRGEESGGGQSLVW
jgi:hypothetical protein